MTATLPDLPRQIIAAIQSVVGSEPVPLHEPTFSGNEWTYVKKCLDSTFVSSVGEFVPEFERRLVEFTGGKHAVAVVNGTAALHVALKLAGVGHGDEVLSPALTFAASANAVVYCGAVPHFVESTTSDLGLDTGLLRDYLGRATERSNGLTVNKATGRVIRALMPMHTFGHAGDLDGMLAIARDFNLVLVEDAAESLGSSYNGRHTGLVGLVGALSFNGNKTITTGGGGAVITDDPEIARRAKHITTTAKLPHRWEYRHDEVGFNYRMPNLNAALGCAQLEQLPALLDAKRALFQRYNAAFRGLNGVTLVNEPAGCLSNFWLQALLLDEASSSQRDAILEATNDAGIMTRPIWELLHHLPHFADCPRMEITVAESLARRVINIPSSAHLAMSRP